MATNTTNYDLKKPAYTDTADIMDINGNMDKVDAALNGLGESVAIVSKNNTHGAITTGQYVYIHGHGSLADGLYTANNNISANVNLSASNVTAVPGGGFNSILNRLGSIKQITSNISAGTSKTITFSAGCWCILFTVFGAATSVCGAWLINGSNSSPVSVPLKTPTQVSVTDGASNVTITNNHPSATVGIVIALLAGTADITIT